MSLLTSLAALTASLAIPTETTYVVQGTVTVCVNKEDMDAIVSANKTGGDGYAVFKSRPGCDTLPVTLVHAHKEDSFMNSSGKRWWALRGENANGRMLYFLLPDSYFADESIIETQ